MQMKNNEHRKNTEKKTRKKISIWKHSIGFLNFLRNLFTILATFQNFVIITFSTRRPRIGRRRTFFMGRLVIAISESFPIFLEAESVLVQFYTKFKFNPNLGGEMKRGRGYPPCWFSLNNSETVKAVTLTFCSIQ